MPELLWGKVSAFSAFSAFSVFSVFSCFSAFSFLSTFSVLVAGLVAPFPTFGCRCRSRCRCRFDKEASAMASGASRTSGAWRFSGSSCGSGSSAGSCRIAEGRLTQTSRSNFYTLLDLKVHRCMGVPPNHPFWYSRILNKKPLVLGYPYSRKPLPVSRGNL